MKLETFFEKFELFAEAPGAVGRLRELVLELAVRGNLSERIFRDSEECSWRNFVEEYDKGIRIVEADYSLPFEIPVEWRWVTLGDLGKTKIRNDIPDNLRVSFVPMAFIPAEYGISAQSEERAWGEVKKGFTHFANGDVVMAKITPCFENAKSAVMRNLVNGFGAGTTELHVFRKSTEVVLPEYVLLYLKSPGFITRGEKRMTGSAGQKRVPHDYFAKSLFPLPPLGEQKRIVAKVNELMALCDQLEAKQQEREARKAVLSRASLARFAEAPNPANLNFIFHKSYEISPAELRRAILTLAVQGKLAPQIPEDKPIHEQFPGLQSVDKEGEKDTPKQWGWYEYRSLTSLVTSGSRGWKDFYSNTGSIFIRTQNIKTDNLVLDEIAYVDLPPAAEGMRTKVLKGDILITITGANVTKAALVKRQLPEAYVSQHIALTRPRWTEMSEWLHLCFLSHGSARGKLETLAYGDKPGLNLDNIRLLVLPLPPLAEQHRIISKVEQLISLVDQLEAEINSSRSTADKLLQALVSEISAGERESRVVAFPSTEANEDGSSKEFTEAVVIAELVRKLATPRYPLGNFRRQKIGYFAHRKAFHDVVEQYQKMAAGPYNPWTEHGGPRNIALKNGFVQPGKSGEMEGLIPGPNIDQIDRYLENDPIAPALSWAIENFRFTKNDRLELLATVDYASEELRKAGRPVTVKEIRNLIAADNKWAPKLDRQLFSEANVKKAMHDLERLLPSFLAKATA